MGKGLRRGVLDAVTIFLVTVAAGLFVKAVVLDACRIVSPSMEPSLATGDYLLFNRLPYSLPHPLVRALLLSAGVPPFASPLLHNPQHGDILVFKNPGEDHGDAATQLYVKRCIGLPGDTVKISHGSLQINSVIYRRLPDRDGLLDYGPYLVPRKGTRLQLSTSTISWWKPLITGEGHVVHTGTNGAVFIDGNSQSTYTVGKDYVFVLGDNLVNSSDSRSWGPVAVERVVGKGLFTFWSRDPGADRDGFWHRLAKTRWSRLGMMVR